MVDINCNDEMIGFHADEVNLPQPEQKSMRKRRDAGRTRLESGLDQKDHPHPKEMASQGSYQMRTMVQDDDCDYDIDDGAYFREEDLEDEDDNPLSALQARERICEALAWDGRLKHEATVKDNCVRQIYPEGYHIDVPVYRVVVETDKDGNETNSYELASGNNWVASDARAVTKWYNSKVGELNQGESDGSQMRRVTKLTKKLARSRTDWKASTASGICITKLVVDHFEDCLARDDKSLRQTWEAIKKALEESSEIKHPVLDSNLAESGDETVKFLLKQVGDALVKIEILDDEKCTRKDARAAWDSVFNTFYFSDFDDSDDDDGSGGGGGGNGKKSASVVVTNSDPARRNDGGGRFG